jgi:hypothetical protein
VEEVCSNKILSPEEQACELHYTNNYTPLESRLDDTMSACHLKSSALS